MKGYHDIAGDGGSRILDQVTGQRARISDGLAGVRHVVAVGSGKGGVGKSTLTLHLAGALRARGLRIAILDADFNGPSQARMAGVERALFVPGSHKVALPRTTSSRARRMESLTRGAPPGSSRCSARSWGRSSGEPLIC
jgi:Mrp family chromosome partitioning ATPase